MPTPKKKRKINKVKLDKLNSSTAARALHSQLNVPQPSVPPSNLSRMPSFSTQDDLSSEESTEELEETSQISYEAFRKRNYRKNESNEQREKRLKKAENYEKEKRRNESNEEKEERLKKAENYEKEKRRNESNKNEIITFDFPPVISDEHLKKCLKDYILATSAASLQSIVCGICAELVQQYEEYDIQNIPNRELIKADSCYEKGLPEYEIEDLLLHPDGLGENQIVRCCKKCLHFLNNNKLPPLSIANNFQIGGTPIQLESLTLPEKMLISVYRPKMYVTTFRSYAGPGTNQRGLKGNTITFPQDVVQIANKLPADPNVLADIIKVVFIGNGIPSKDQLKKVFTVRREKIFSALEFLVENHPLYSKVEISHDVDLPVDDIPAEIWDMITVHEDGDREDQKEHANYTPQTDAVHISNTPQSADVEDASNTTPTDFPVSAQNPDDAVIMDSTGLLDLEGSSVHTATQMQSAIQSLQGTVFVPHGSLPITDYNNPLLWIGAYPWLFPYGTGGPEIQRRAVVSLKAYVQHLLLHADKKFRADLSFKFHVFNVLQKRDVSLHTSLLIRQPRFQISANQIGNITHESLVKIVESADKKSSLTEPNLQVLLKNLSTAGAKIRGSPYCKKIYRREIHGLMVQDGMPAFFITISPAAVHSPILLQLAGVEVCIDSSSFEDLPSQLQRAQIVAQDPVAASKFFDIVIDAFVSYLLGFGQHDGGVLGHIAAYYGCIEEQGTGTLHIHMLAWLQGFMSRSELESKLDDEDYKRRLIQYLESIIMQGFLDGFSADEAVNVSEISCKRPVNPVNDDFELKLAEDVNKLVKVANTHRHTFTCYKYKKGNECRFGFPRELYPETVIKEEGILLKRTSQNINNYNPILMTCIRSNHDIKFIPSGKDGKACAFYMTDYATKSALSSHQMVPLIAASMKKVNSTEPNMNMNNDLVSRSKALITKCLNRITTETEISGSHVCHFLLGSSDKKASHCFSALNLHTVMSWINEEMQKYDNMDASNDDDLRGEDDNEDQAGYMVQHGNSGLILTNQLIDYISRGNELSEMSLYEYCSKIYKVPMTDEEKRKMSRLASNDKNKTDVRGRKPQPRYVFDNNHPQSETHVQILRSESLVPSLSFFPPSEDGNPERFQICMLVLFKPFVEFENLYNGISWEESYQVNDFGKNLQFIKNIQEMHRGIQEKKNTTATNVDDGDDGQDDGQDDVADGVDCNLTYEDDEYSADVLFFQTDDDDDDGTANGVEVIKNSNLSMPLGTEGPQLSHSAANIQQQQWKGDIEHQSQTVREQLYYGEMDCNDSKGYNDMWEKMDNNDGSDDIEFVVHRALQDDDIETVYEETLNKFSLNKKQAACFHLITSNAIKRMRDEPVQQILAYIGGPGGTGKSQIIKAVVYFHEQLKLMHSLRLCAYTGTAAKVIGGSTISSLAMIRNANFSKLEKIWEKVQTVLLDEVSMTGCRLLAKLSRNVTRAKHASPNLPFGGVDVFFFGDFIQYPPVLDTPLYCHYMDYDDIKASTTQSDVLKQLGISLWKQLTHIALLTEQMRVTDEIYQDLLNRMREGKCTQDDYIMLSSRVLENNCNINSLTANNPMIIVPGNKLRMGINNHFIRNHSQSCRILVAHSVDQSKHGNLSNEQKIIVKTLPHTKTDSLPTELPLYVGMQVFLTRNTSTELGLTNGTKGVIHHIELHPEEHLDNNQSTHALHHLPQYVVVHFKDARMKPLQGLPPNHVPIFPVRGNFSTQIKGMQQRLSASRKQLPLEPAYCCTAHKSQGQTLHKVLVDLVPPQGMKKTDISFAYVPLSRVRTLEDLAILRPFDVSVILKRPSKDLKAMMDDFKERDICKDM